MKVYICRQCSVPCYLINVHQISGVDPDTCPYRGRSYWEKTTVDDVKEQLIEDVDEDDYNEYLKYKQEIMEMDEQNAAREAAKGGD